MSEHYNLALLVGAVLSAIAALLHVGIIVGGPAWYRFFGAGEKLARADAAGSIYPAIITAGIAAVLATWAAYALAGAGLIAPLPWLKLALVVITAVYLLRGLAIVPLLLFARPKATPFLRWSSLICMIYGGVHLAGVAQVWDQLG